MYREKGFENVSFFQKVMLHCDISTTIEWFVVVENYPDNGYTLELPSIFGQLDFLEFLNGTLRLFYPFFHVF